MRMSVKYLTALNLISLISRIGGNNIFNLGDSNYEYEFEHLYKWTSFNRGFCQARKVNKPIMLFVHKMQCPGCVKLKKKFVKSVRLMDLSDRFIMIKAEMGKDSNLKHKTFHPDGKYVPRILFFTSEGKLIKEAYNRCPDADKDYKYFYKSAGQVVETMLYVLNKYTNDALPVAFQQEQSKPEACDPEDEIILPTLLY
ncbi:thioredoxin domain-containing protein 12-like [Ceratina calcarata]|uniref:Thioredoxin domain-containing protein 12-like n=1 Tax=Ceratina calcarata TaxID=156304 RepID=A0AAJ7JGW5_9HYME|nr:thioredoxin domain-containing protein 12-like [Ceratina calcarata]